MKALSESMEIVDSTESINGSHSISSALILGCLTFPFGLKYLAIL